MYWSITPKKGIGVDGAKVEVDGEKVEVIERLPLPIFIKGWRSFLRDVAFYRRYINDFKKIAHLLYKLLENECKFYFDESCLKAFGEFKEKLVSSPIIIFPCWNKPFEVMCDSSGIAFGVVLGERREKILYQIYFTSKALNEIQELLAVVFLSKKLTPIFMAR